MKKILTIIFTVLLCLNTVFVVNVKADDDQANNDNNQEPQQENVDNATYIDYSTYSTEEQTLISSIIHPKKITFVYDGNEIKDVANVGYVGSSTYDNKLNYNFCYYYTDNTTSPYDKDKMEFVVEFEYQGEAAGTLKLNYTQMDNNYITKTGDNNQVEYLSVMYSDYNLPYINILPRDISNIKFYDSNDKEVTFDQDYEYGVWNRKELNALDGKDTIVFSVWAPNYNFSYAVITFDNNETKTINYNGDELKDRCYAFKKDGIDYNYCFLFADELEDGAPESAVEEAYIIFGEDSYELIGHDFDSYIRWNFEWYGDEDELNELLNAINNNGIKDMGLKLKYRLKGSTDYVEVDCEDSFSYGNYRDVHGYYYEITTPVDNYNEIDMFCLGYCECGIDASSIQGAYIYKNNVRYDFIYNADISNDYVLFYELTDELDRSTLTDNDDIIIVIDDETETRIGNGRNDCRCTYNFEYSGNGVWFTKNGNPDNIIVFVIDYCGNTENKKTSFIKLFDENSYPYEIHHNDDGSYFWDIYVDPAEFYSVDNSDVYFDVRLANNGHYDNITFEQQEDNNNPAVEQKKETINEVDTVLLKIRKWSNPTFNIIGSNTGSQESFTQVHQFCLQVGINDILKYTLINSFNLASSSFVTDGGIISKTSGMINNLIIGVNVNKDTTDFVNQIRNLPTDADHTNLNYESNYINITFKDNAELIKKEYSVSADADYPMVTYTLKNNDNDVVQTVSFSLRYEKGNWSGQSIMINGNNYNCQTFYKNGRQYTLYIHNDNDVQYEKFFEYTGYQHQTLIVNYQRDNYNPETDDYLYNEGKQYMKESGYNIEVYVPKDGVVLDGDVDVDDLNRITNTSKIMTLKYNSCEGNDYDGVLSDMKRILSNPTYYKDLEGNWQKVKVFDDYDSFESYSGNAVATYTIVQKIGNKYQGYILFKTRYFTYIKTYQEYYSDENWVSAEPYKLSHINGQSDAELFEAAVNAVKDKKFAKIILESSITLDRDVVVSHMMYNGDDISGDNSSWTNPQYGLEIDLNGHNINVGDHVIDISHNSWVYFTNSKIETVSGNDVFLAAISQIIGTGNQTIRNYGFVGIYNNVELINEYGTALTAYDISNCTYIGSGSSIYANKAIEVCETTTGYTDNYRNEVGVQIHGDIRAYDYAVYFNCLRVNEYLKYNIRFYRDYKNEDQDYVSVVSNAYGVYANGNVNVELNNCEMIADYPFVVNGGTYKITDSNIKATAYYDVEADYTADNPNGALFLVDSLAKNASTVKVNFQVSSREILEAEGPLVADTAVSSQSKISKVDIACYNDKSDDSYILTGDNLFVNVPKAAVNIDGGNYSTTDFKNYVDTQEYLCIATRGDDYGDYHFFIYRGQYPTSLTNETKLSEIRLININDRTKTYDAVYTGSHDETAGNVTRKLYEFVVSLDEETYDAISNDVNIANDYELRYAFDGGQISIKCVKPDGVTLKADPSVVSTCINRTDRYSCIDHFFVVRGNITTSATNYTSVQNIRIVDRTDTSISYEGKYYQTIVAQSGTGEDVYINEYVICMPEADYDAIVVNDLDRIFDFDLKYEFQVINECRSNSDINLDIAGFQVYRRVYTLMDGNTEKNFYCLRKAQSFKTAENYRELIEALNNPKIFAINLSNDFNESLDETTLGSYYNQLKDGVLTISFENNAFRSLNLNNKILNNVKFVVGCDSDDYSEDDSFRLENGTLISSDSLIVNEDANISLTNITLQSTDAPAIVVHGGRISAWDNCIIEGSNALAVNLEDSTHFIKADFSSTTLRGLDAAILVEKTYSELNSENYISFHSNDDYAKTKVVSTAAKTNDIAAAIEIKDNIQLYLHGTEITSNNYAIYCYDSIRQLGLGDSENNSGINLEDNCQLSAYNLIRLDKNTNIQIRKSVLSAENNVLETSGSGRFYIESGWFRAENGNIVSYYDDITNSYRHSIHGGYFNKAVDDKSVNGNNADYKYVCIQVEDDNSEYPYSIVKKYTEKNNYQSVTLSYKREIVVNDNLLDGVISQAEREYLESNNLTAEVVMTIKEDTNEERLASFEKLGDIKEVYDIHINKNIGDEKTRLEEVDSYQEIVISLDDVKDDNEDIIISYSDQNKVVVYHKHGDSDPVQMKKVSAANGALHKEECYYITPEEDGADHYDLHVVTKRFSSFGIGENETAIIPSNPKTYSTLNLQYKDYYAENEEIAVPDHALLTDGETEISVDDVNIVYTNAKGTEAYYSNIPPVVPGYYVVTWTIKEGNSTYSGSGSQEFSIGVENNAKLAGASLSLVDSVFVNMGFIIDDDVAQNADAYIRIRDVNKNTSKDLPVSSLKKNGSYYMVEENVPAKELTNVFECQLFVGDEVNSPVMSYSGINYLNTVIDPNNKENLMAKLKYTEEEYTKLRNLCIALANYGSYAQTYFGYHTDDLANNNQYIDETMKDVSDVTIENQYSNMSVEKNGSLAGIEYTQSALGLKERTVFYLQFAVEENYDPANYSFKVDGQTLTPIISGKNITVNYASVAKKLGVSSNIVVSDGTNSVTYTVCPLYYGYSVLKSSDEVASKELKDVCRAIYKYYDAARTYFGD